VSTLVISKLCFSAFLSPLLLLFRQLPSVRSKQEWLLQRISKSYRSVKYMDHQTAFWLVGPLENCLILGLLVPTVFPLVAVVYFTHMVAFRYTREHLGCQASDEVRPPMVYLYIALGVGNIWNAAYFWASDLEGKWLVTTVSPVGSIMAWYAAAWFLHDKEEAEDQEEYAPYFKMEDLS